MLDLGENQRKLALLLLFAGIGYAASVYIERSLYRRRRLYVY
jgi:hypothetical protein